MKVTIVGAGHVGLPLGLFMERVGKHNVSFVEQDKNLVEKLMTSEDMLFGEDGFGNLQSYNFDVFENIVRCPESEAYIICVPTPLDSTGVPEVQTLMSAMITTFTKAKAENALVVIRSTIPMRFSNLIERARRQASFGGEVIYAPERLAEGQAWNELMSFPQIIGHDSVLLGPEVDTIKELFNYTECLFVTLEEAAFMKLATNAYSYAHFAIANELQMIAISNGLDFSSLRKDMMMWYPRLESLPKPGLTAGTCLRKDWKLLTNNIAGETFFGSAHKTNEDYPDFIVDAAMVEYGAVDVVVGLGFKPYSADLRDSLSAKVIQSVFFHCGHSPYAIDPFVENGLYSIVDGQIVKWEPGVKGLTFMVVDHNTISQAKKETDAAVFALPYQNIVQFKRYVSAW